MGVQRKRWLIAVLMIAMLGVVALVSVVPAFAAWNTIIVGRVAGGIHDLAVDAAGNPVFTYSEAGGTNPLRLVHCSDPYCQNPAPVTIAASGFSNGVEIDSSGNPVVLYSSGGGLYLLHCDDPSCAGTETPTLLHASGGSGGALRLDASGNPVILYGAAGQTLLLHCDDPACAGTETSVMVDTSFGYAADQSLALVLDPAGNPVVTYTDGGNQFKVLHCDDPSCQSESGGTVLHNRYVPALIEVDAAGHPMIVHYGNGITFMHCDDPTCAGTETLLPISNGVMSFGFELDSAGNPVIAYMQNGGVHLLHCDDPYCAGTETPVIVSPRWDNSIMTMRLDAQDGAVIGWIEETSPYLYMARWSDVPLPTATPTLPPTATPTQPPTATPTTPPAQPPAAPTRLTAKTVQAKVTLTWRDAAGETSYLIERSLNGTTWTQIGTAGANVTSFTDAAVTKGTTYQYRVRAYNSSTGLYSSYSNTVSIRIK